MGAYHNSPTQARLEIKVIGQVGYTSLHLWAVTGAGSGTRRQRLYTVRVPLPLTHGSLPALLRAAAEQVETHPTLRWQPPGASASPSGDHRGD